jgi:hypothetical protein
MTHLLATVAGINMRDNEANYARGVAITHSQLIINAPSQPLPHSCDQA